MIQYCQFQLITFKININKNMFCKKKNLFSFKMMHKHALNAEV